MRLLLVIFFMMALAGSVSANPFLVCDPAEGVEYYLVYIDTVELGETEIPAQADGSLKYDIGHITPGAYRMTGKACNSDWGCSDASVPFTSKNASGVPNNMRLDP